jgi:hypothetical protein
MASFLVLQPPGEPRSERAVFVRDGFHFLAFLLPPVWLLAQRLGIEAGIVVGVAAALALGGEWLDLGSAALLLWLFVAILIGLEGPALHAAALRRRGWREKGVVEAASREDAEARFLADLHDEPEPAAKASPWDAAGTPQPRGPPAGPALGLFSYPGSR